MRTTNKAARGRPLAALLFFVALIALPFAVHAAGSILVQQSLDEEQIFVAGTWDEDNLADLTLTLEALAPVGGHPIDCILVIDTSATADLSSAKSFAFDLLGVFDDDDRIALVSYATDAQLAAPLGATRNRLRTAIADLSVGGKSALGVAMQTARRELAQNGRENAVLVEILLADGQSNSGFEPDVEGEVAADSGIRIISVGVGPLINRTLLEQFAAEGGGLYFPRPTTDALTQIAEHLDVDAIATDVRIEKRLPEGLRLVSASPSPTRVEILSDGTTSIQWWAAELLVGQSIEFELTIEATEKGTWNTDFDSLVTYVDFRGIEGSVEIAPLTLVAVEPNKAPIAAFEFDPETPTTSDVIAFTDLSSDPDEDEDIVAWLWDFGDETQSTLQNPAHRFGESGTYEVRLIAVDERGEASEERMIEVYVGNTAPYASFGPRYIPSGEVAVRDIDIINQPRVGVEIMLDASGSYDLDDSIVAYEWDFDGDGTVDQVTSVPETVHTFETGGEHVVILTVVDSEGGRSSEEKTIDVLATVSTKRAIETGLPDDWTIPGGTLHVTIMLDVNTTVNGIAISETIPEGWTFAEVESDGATMRKNGQTIEWLFLEKFAADGVNSQREIRYTLTAPAGNVDREQATVRGTLGSSSPRITQTIAGDDRVTVVSILPVPVVISRWDAGGLALDLETTTGEEAAAGVDLFIGETIGFDQIQYAVSLWLSEGVVPLSGGAIIDLGMMQDLIAYWLTESSVHDPLP